MGEWTPWSGQVVSDQVTTTATTRTAQVSAAQVGSGGDDVVYHAEPLGGVTYTVEPHPPTPRDDE